MNIEEFINYIKKKTLTESKLCNHYQSEDIVSIEGGAFCALCLGLLLTLSPKLG